MLKRIRLSITRRKNQTIILGIVMFVIANLILATISIKNATDEQMAFAKASIGGEVTLSANMESLRQPQENMGNMEGEKPSFEKVERPNIYLNYVTTISQSQYVKDYTYSITVSANASSFEVVESNNNFGGRGDMDNIMKSMGNIQIEGINSYAYISGVQNNTISLTSGTYFDESTNDKVIISYDLATLNELEVGDTITIETIEDEEEIELEIIGIYDTSTSDSNDIRSFIDSSNIIYMNVDTASKFLNEESYNEGNYSVNNVTYYLNNPEDYELFIEDANNKVPELEENNLTLSINMTEYENMVGPIESVGNFANVILVVVIIAAVVIISLIINSQIKERKYEMGVLLSLGETKKHIVIQILGELVIISTLAFILSMGTGTILARTMGNSLLENQLTMAEEQSENNFGRPNQMIRPNTSENVVRTIDINPSLSNYLILFGTCYAIIFVSMIIPSANIMKYEPKTILTRRDA